jgi:WS/DGAT/MGAT family acyltransferase
MPTLSFLDAALFLLESPDRHFNVGPLVMLDPPVRGRAGFADRLSERLLERPAGPPFTYRLNWPPLELPTLEEDPDFDITRHVHRITLKAPGNLKQLSEEVGKLHRQPLDRAHPLWQFYLIDGLEDGKVALFGKMHHGVIDGRTFVEVVSNWLAVSPRQRTVRAMWEGLPQRVDRAARASAPVGRLLHGLGQAAGIASTIGSLYRMLAGQALGAAAGAAGTMMVPFTGIPNVLQGRTSTERSFAYCRLPIAEIKTLAKSQDTSVNDLLLLTLDVALDRYLDELGTRPDKPLIAAMPVGLAGAKGGNQIAILQFPLGGPGRSPVDRLAEIRRHTATVKDAVKREDSATVMLFTTLVHGLPALLEKLGLRDAVTVSNVVVSNPFGLPEKRYLMGAPVSLALPVSIVNPGQTLNVTAVTLDDHLQLAFLAIPDAVPKVYKLAQYTRDAFERLKHALPAPSTAELPVRRSAGRAGKRLARSPSSS